VLFPYLDNMVLDELSPAPPIVTSEPARFWHPAPTVPGHDVFARVGRGSTGTVWKARHRLVDQPVAVKVLSEGFRDRAEERRQSFCIEALISRTLAYRHLVQVFDVGLTTAGMPFLSMELAVRTLSEKDSMMTKLQALPRPSITFTQTALSIAM
jgi:hypothetical protein